MTTVGRIGIIGAGAIGGAIGRSLSDSHDSVIFFDIDKSKSQVNDLAVLAQSSDYIFLCIPSWAVSSVLDELIAHMTPHHIVICLAKGALANFVTMDTLLATKLVHLHANYGLLAGPMLASEMQAAQPAYGILALTNKTGAGALLQSFKQGNVYLKQSEDLHSVALCSVLKNIYALSFGIHDGLGLGANSKGALTSKVIFEMTAILQKLQADPAVVLDYAGIGDLLATGWSENSYNHRIGFSLASGSHPDGVNGEGVMSLRHIESVINRDDFPILARLAHIVINGAPAETFYEIIKKS